MKMGILPELLRSTHAYFESIGTDTLFIHQGEIHKESKNGLLWVNGQEFLFNKSKLNIFLK
jgi:hypothetical protein